MCVVKRSQFDVVLIMLSINKQVEGKIRDQRTKKQGNKGTTKSCETVTYTCRYTSGHYNQIGIKCPLVVIYLQV